MFLITLILMLTVIGCSLFLCFYYKCYSVVNFKLIKFYKRTQNFKSKPKLINAVIFKNTQEPVEPKTSLVPS